ncbi:MAG: PAC2 family protein [Dehalococcoidia bacterium]
MDGFEIQPVPALRAPVVVVAFGGWSDTGTVTTDTAQRLVDTNGGRSFLEVDPEDYYVFTDTRPTVKLDAFGLREVQWPKNEAFYALTPQSGHDLVVVKGVEPNLRWRTFTSRLGDAIAELSPSLVCTLVARPATTPHTRPIPISGSSADASLAAKFGLGRSNYQGPTGIVGVLHDVLRRRGCPLISLVASVPHYLNVEENPPATMALLKALTPVVGFTPALGDLEEQGERFLERVEEASRGDDQIRAYVRSLEEHYGENEQESSDQGGGELPSAADILRDVEDLLRGGSDS